MKYEAGDLVEIAIPHSFNGIWWDVEREPEMASALVLYGHPTSVYVEARPVRSIDTVQYAVICGGRRLSIYEEDISRLLTGEEK